MSTATFKQSRSGLTPENLQEVIDAEQSPQWATMAGQQQYLSPDWLAEHCYQLIRKHNRSSYMLNVLDPQCGLGGLLVGDPWVDRYGIDIDNRIDKTRIPRAKILTGNCVKAFEVIDDVYPDLRFDMVNANPPFGKRWKLEDGKIADSTELTWKFVTEHGCRGFFIANDVTLKRLGIDKDPRVFHYETHSNVWKQCDVVIGIAFWEDDEAKASPNEQIGSVWSQLTTIMEEEAKHVPPFNVTLKQNGMLQMHLSTRTQVKRKLTREDVLRLTTVNDSHPLSLTIDKETRSLLRELIDCGFYTIEPKAKTAIESALADVATLACPIMPTTDFEKVAYADEEETLLCKSSGGLSFTPGKRYPIKTKSYNFTQSFKRAKVHFNEETGVTYTEQHSCVLSGQDRYIQVTDDSFVTHRFLAVPDEKSVPHKEHDESTLWKIFQEPVVATVAERHPEKLKGNLEMLKLCEELAGYTYYPGQLQYLARVGIKDYGLIAADVGTGKTLCALSLIQMKGPKRSLIIAPQGTMRSSGSEDDEEGEEYQASQWVSEIHRFAPSLPCFQIFCLEDYQRIKKQNGGVLPEGAIYISYYQALFGNKALESLPESWTTEKLWSKFNTTPLPTKKQVLINQLWLDVDTLLDVAPAAKWKNGFEFTYDGHERKVEEVRQIPLHDYTEGVGMEKEGIRCIVAPCLATICGHEFDFVAVDEVQTVCNLDAQVTQMLIRLQPRYRYGFSATPIPNILSNIFSLMGWICVDDWFKGARRNSAFPFAREDLTRFNDLFLTEERDLTQEQANRAANPDWRGKCVKTSPVISSPARLLKLLKPSMAFISKEACNPNVVPCKVVDIRVPMGKQQTTLYGHFLNRANIKCRHPLIRARKQIAYLRNITADPAGFTHGGPIVSSNFNPKTIAILELTREILSRDEQVVIVSARVGQTNTLHQRLVAAGIKVARIDSTLSASEHAGQSNRFKAKHAQVMLMGIKCAVGHSYPECPNLIVGSLEYSYGSKHQAEGRVWRVNSKYPVTVYCVLCKDSIEETMFDVVATKQDAATICLYGRRVPRDFRPVDMGEVLAKSMAAFTEGGISEVECEQKWPELKAQLHAIAA